MLGLLISTFMILGLTKCRELMTFSTTSCGAVADKHMNGTSLSNALNCPNCPSDSLNAFISRCVNPLK